MGIQLVQNLASKAQEGSGDGTTTACILAQALCHNMIDAPPMNVHDFNNLINSLKDFMIHGLDSEAEEVRDEDILSIATIAANNDIHLGTLIADSLNKVGRDGIITVEESKTHKTEILVREGLEIDEGYMSHLMANSEDGKCTFNNPLIFLSNLAIRNFNEILPMMEHAANNKQPLVIFCKGMDGNAMNNVVMNLLQKTIDVAVVTAPNFGDAQLDELSDISSLLGGKVYNDESKDDPKLVSIDDFGECDRVVVGKESSTIVGGGGDTTDKITQLRNLAKEIKGHDLARIKSRIARLTGGVATIRIGAGSQLEMREKKERLDDALNATKAALSEGIVVGGGFSLLQSAFSLGDSVGEKLVVEALSAPIKTLLDNSGGEYDEGKLLVELKVFDALDCKYKSLEDYNVYDPVKVTRNSFVAAMSIASLFLTTDVAVLLEE
jgi:chaperonin GroEL